MKTQKVGLLRYAYVVFCVLFCSSLVAVDVVNAADVDVSVSEEYGITFPTKLIENYSSINGYNAGVSSFSAGFGAVPIILGANQVQGQGNPRKPPSTNDKVGGGVAIGVGSLVAAGGIAGGLFFASRAHRLSARKAIVNDVNFPAELKGQDPNIQTAKAWLVAAYLWDKQAYVLAEDIEKKAKKQKQNSAEEMRVQILSDNQAAIASAIEEIYKPFLLLKTDQQIDVVHSVIKGKSYGSVSTKMENFLEANAKEMPTA